MKEITELFNPTILEFVSRYELRDKYYDFLKSKLGPEKVDILYNVTLLFASILKPLKEKEDKKGIIA